LPWRKAILTSIRCISQSKDAPICSKTWVDPYVPLGISVHVIYARFLCRALGHHMYFVLDDIPDRVTFVVKTGFEGITLWPLALDHEEPGPRPCVHTGTSFPPHRQLAIVEHLVMRMHLCMTLGHLHCWDYTIHCHWKWKPHIHQGCAQYPVGKYSLVLFLLLKLGVCMWIPFQDVLGHIGYVCRPAQWSIWDCRVHFFRWWFFDGFVLNGVHFSPLLVPDVAHSL